MVRKVDKIIQETATPAAKAGKPPTKRATEAGRGRPVNTPGGIPFLREALAKYRLDKLTLDKIVGSAWRKGTVAI